MEDCANAPDKTTRFGGSQRQRTGLPRHRHQQRSVSIRQGMPEQSTSSAQPILNMGKATLAVEWLQSLRQRKHVSPCTKRPLQETTLDLPSKLGLQPLQPKVTEKNGDLTPSHVRQGTGSFQNAEKAIRQMSAPPTISRHTSKAQSAAAAQNFRAKNAFASLMAGEAASLSCSSFHV